MTPNLPDSLQSADSARASGRRGCLHTARRAFLWLVVLLLALVLLGSAFQAVAVELDKRSYAPRGTLYTVDGHRMHLVCQGDGEPVVILQAGASADSLWWYWAQSQLAVHTRVCAYDRPGMGWSESAEGSRDARTMNAELHALLQQAGITGPLVMAGHSFGAVLTRVYAAQYPDQIAGVVLVDSQLVTPKSFTTPDEAQQHRTFFDVTQALISAGTRVGLVRLLEGGVFTGAGYPSGIAAELAGMTARNQTVDAYYAENGPAFVALQAASADAEDLGALPVAVVWAGVTYAGNEGHPGLRPLTDELATYSTNVEVRVVEGADHGSILGNEQFARQVTDAILAVMEEVRPLAATVE